MKKYTKKSLKSVSALLGASALALGMGASPAAQAGTQDYLGELSLVGFNFCPRGTFNADGTLLPISQWQALFSLYGTMYGGDGRTTFGLPDLRGRSPISEGTGPGLPNRRMGDQGGTEHFTLTAGQMPSHTHSATASATLHANSGAGNSAAPTDHVLAMKSRTKIYSDTAPNVAMSAGSITASVTVGNTGGGQSVSKRSPFLTLRYCVNNNGSYPSRT